MASGNDHVKSAANAFAVACHGFESIRVALEGKTIPEELLLFSGTPDEVRREYLQLAFQYWSVAGEGLRNLCLIPESDFPVPTWARR